MAASPEAERLFSAHDVVGIAMLSFARLLAAACPPSAWRPACRVAAWPLGVWRARRGPRAGRVSPRPEVLSATVQSRLLASELESFVLMARLGRRSSWDPEIRLEGGPHLEAALAKGRGAVLWVHRFQPFVHFVALSRAGFRVVRLSNPEHGHFSRSRFGIRVLNPFQLRAEAQHCERIVVAPGDLVPLRVLSRRLAANEIVAMYADRRAPRAVELPVLGGTVVFGVGPAALANLAGAALLPVFPLAEGRRGFRVVIEAPLPVAGGRAAAEEALLAHAPVLERYVKAYPDQWLGFSCRPHGGVPAWRSAAR